MSVILTKRDQQYLEIIEDLNKPRGDGLTAGLKTRLHSGQIDALKPLMRSAVLSIFQPCGRKFGKMLSLSTPILTPSGFKLNGELREGDVVFNEQGEQRRITQVHDIKESPEAYRVHFDNGATIDACADHLWFTWTKKDRKNFSRGLSHNPSVKNTRELFNTQMQGKEYNHSIPFTKALDMPEASLPIPPYLLGVWLGDGTKGSSIITGKDGEVFDKIESLGYRVGHSTKSDQTHTVYGLVTKLKQHGLYRNKHVPTPYLLSSKHQRRELLKGLLDTDGTCNKKGNSVQFSNTNKNLADAVFFLAQSLGLNCTRSEKQPNKKRFKKEPKKVYIVSFHPQGQELFCIKRKQERVQPYKKTPHHTIVKVERIPSVPMRCISVEGDSHLYLAGEYLIPTHNTEEAAYFLWHQALTVPGSACYYIVPEASHGRKIVWDTGRLQYFLGNDSHKYIMEPKNMEMKIPFKNGSFIQVVGSENYGVANGLTPHAIVYDEFKLFHPRWHIDFAPNRVAKGAKLLIIGTLPTPGDRNYEQYFSLLEQAQGDKDWSVVIKTTWDNPIMHLPDQKRALEAEISSLRLRGEEDVVQREYYSKIVAGGKRSIFPMFSRERHVKKHASMMDEISRDVKKLDWHCVLDPGSSTVFAGLIVALNPWTKRVYVLDEIYETTKQETSTGKIYPRLEALMRHYNPKASIEDDWMKTYDEAAAWFSVECLDRFGVYFSPTLKQSTTKNDGISLIKDQLTYEVISISDKCVNLIKEIENYAVTDKGDLPRNGDHAIDCLRYFNQASNYSSQEVQIAVKHRDPIEVDRFRQDRFDDELRMGGDWTEVDFE